jgi:hypothetical protein
MWQGIELDLDWCMCEIFFFGAKLLFPKEQEEAD